MEDGLRLLDRLEQGRFQRVHEGCGQADKLARVATKSSSGVEGREKDNAWVKGFRRSGIRIMEL